MARRFFFAVDVILPAVIGIVCAFVAVGIYDAELFKERRLMDSLNDFVRAIAELVRAGAWPGVVLFLLFRYRDRLGELIPRLRKLPGGTEFDAPPPLVQSTEEPQTPAEELQALAAPAIAGGAGPAHANNGALPNPFEAARSPEVIEVENLIANMPELQALPDAAAREIVLRTIAATLFVAAMFERIEATIWGSQLHMLNALNAAPDGMARDEVQRRYYDVAKKHFPAFFEQYPFDNYLQFLIAQRLVRDENGILTITPYGREYLVWRVKQGKAMKVEG